MLKNNFGLIKFRVSLFWIEIRTRKKFADPQTDHRLSSDVYSSKVPHRLDLIAFSVANIIYLVNENYMVATEPHALLH